MIIIDNENRKMVGNPTNIWSIEKYDMEVIRIRPNTNTGEFVVENPGNRFLITLDDKKYINGTQLRVSRLIGYPEMKNIVNTDTYEFDGILEYINDLGIVINVLGIPKTTAFEPDGIKTGGRKRPRKSTHKRKPAKFRRTARRNQRKRTPKK
jgi:hypothetical protein